MALAWLDLKRREEGMKFLRTGMRLKRGVRAGRQATMMAMLTSRATILGEKSQRSGTTKVGGNGRCLLQILISIIPQLGSELEPVV